MDKQQAIKILKNTGYIGNEVGVAFDVAIKSMEKLQKIEQIVNQSYTEDEMYCALVDIKKVLESED